jgi:hypothetical protein
MLILHDIQKEAGTGRTIEDQGSQELSFDLMTPRILEPMLRGGSVANVTSRNQLVSWNSVMAQS